MNRNVTDVIEDKNKRPSRKFSKENLGTIIQWMLWLLLLSITIAKFVPISPRMPASGIDASWQFGCNQAIAQGLSFGNDIILTFGPYASVYTMLYHPSTVFMMVSGTFYLALSYWLCFVLLTWNSKWPWILVFCISFTGLRYSPDTLLFSLPLLIGLTTFKIVVSENGKRVKGKLVPLLLLIMFAPLGLLPLVKGSMLIICMTVVILCSVFLIIHRHRLFALICLFSPLISMLFFWMVSGQPSLGLPKYLVNLAPIITGYTEAMASDGNFREVILYVIASVLLLLAVIIHRKMARVSRVFLFCLYFVFLFLSFKAGFVRHDAHAMTSGSAILIAALFLPFINHSLSIFPVLVFALITWFNIDNNYIKISASSVLKNLRSPYSKAWSGMQNSLENQNWRRLKFDSTVNRIRLQASFPVLNGTTDIYSFNQSYLISSGNTWSPRPVFQSYAAFSPELAEINKKHLLGNRAPENIVFSIEPIDGRFPAIEDGASWPVLLVNYRPERMIHNYLFLKKTGQNATFEDPVRLKSESHAFGEQVVIPCTSEPVFAQIEIKPTFWGRIVSFLYKPTQLQITVELTNGVKKQYRLVSGMVKSGFIISPLVENTTEFGMLYGPGGHLQNKQVKSVVIAPREGNSRIWAPRYTIRFSKIHSRSENEILTSEDILETSHNSSPSDDIKAKLPAGERLIDMLNDTHPARGVTGTSEYLSLKGWLAFSAKEVIPYDGSFITLKRQGGILHQMTTHRIPRKETNAAFDKQVLAEVGHIGMK